MGTAEARCLLAGHDLLFIGNSVVRRQMYTILDLLAGPSAHRQLNDFSSVSLPAFKATRGAEAHIKRSWIWDQDNATYGYHAAQLFTIDLTTGEHPDPHPKPHPHPHPHPHPKPHPNLHPHPHPHPYPHSHPHPHPHPNLTTGEHRPPLHPRRPPPPRSAFIPRPSAQSPQPSRLVSPLTPGP